MSTASVWMTRGWGHRLGREPGTRGSREATQAFQSYADCPLVCPLTLVLVTRVLKIERPEESLERRVG